jgi:hypothetical protein
VARLELAGAVIVALAPTWMKYRKRKDWFMLRQWITEPRRSQLTAFKGGIGVFGVPIVLVKVPP